MSSCRAPSSRLCCVLRFGLSIAGFLLLAPTAAAVQSGVNVREFRFLARGGVVNFVNPGGQVRFQISAEAAAREKLVVSSKLLQLAVPLSWSPAVIPSKSFKISAWAR